MFTELLPFVILTHFTGISHNLRTVPPRILKFYIWIAYKAIADPYFYAPNFREVEGAYCFCFVCSSVRLRSSGFSACL